MCGAGCASSSCSARSSSTPWSTMPPGTKKCKKVGKTCLFSALLEYSMLWSTVNYASRYKKTCKKVGKTCLFSALLVYTLVNFASRYKKTCKKGSKTYLFWCYFKSYTLFNFDTTKAKMWWLISEKLWLTGRSTGLLGKRSRVRIHHLLQWSWRAAGSLCNTEEWGHLWLGTGLLLITQKGHLHFKDIFQDTNYSFWRGKSVLLTLLPRSLGEGGICPDWCQLAWLLHAVQCTVLCEGDLSLLSFHQRVGEGSLGFFSFPFGIKVYT